MVRRAPFGVDLVGRTQWLATCVAQSRVHRGQLFPSLGIEAIVVESTLDRTLCRTALSASMPECNDHATARPSKCATEFVSDNFRASIGFPKHTFSLRSVITWTAPGRTPRHCMLHANEH